MESLVSHDINKPANDDFKEILSQKLNLYYQLFLFKLLLIVLKIISNLKFVPLCMFVYLIIII